MGVKSTVKKAENAMMRAVGAHPDPQEQDLLTTLKTEHDEVKGLLSDLEKADGAAQRKGLVRRIQKALVPHTKAEGKVLYGALIALKDKETQTDGHEGNLEHDLASLTLNKLAGISSASSPEHKATAKVLKELVEHHIKEEESQVWNDAKEHFSDEERVDLNRRYLKAKAQIKVL